MIQILGLRSFTKNDGKEQTYDAFHERNWRSTSVLELLKNLDKTISSIPENERYNIFYTLANCTTSKREFETQGVIAFDIDKMGVKTKEDKIQYGEIVCEVLGLTKNNAAFIDSGNGLHVIFFLKESITSANFFRNNRAKYKELCEKIQSELLKQNLPGSLDPSIFEPRRILRLPGTENRKPHQPNKLASVLHLPEELSTVANFISQANSEAKDETETKEKKKTTKKVEYLHLTADSEAIQEQCKFLKWTKNQQENITEPEWYAALSIVARLPGGEKLAHEYSNKHPKYSASETNEKIKQALDKSGPRFCKNIDEIWMKSGDGLGCKSCPHYNKIQSPIQIESEEFIASEATGFHKVIQIDGKIKTTPDFEGLRRYLHKKTPYVVLDPGRIVYTWTGTHYKEVSKLAIEAFAQHHFKPIANNQMVSEFRQLVERHNLKPVEWFTNSNSGKMNFLNGVLEIATGAFFPSNKSLGFRHVLPYAYDHTAQAPMFANMLEKITCHDKKLATILLEFIGYCLSGDPYWCHKALVMVGDGSNGKSTILNIIKRLAGNNNFSAMKMTDLASEYHRQVLDGKLFNLTEEASHKSFYDTSILKGLVGGAGVQVRAPYGLPYNIVNTAKMVLTCNELPPNWDNTSGMARRLIIIPFNHTFSPQDEDFNPHIDRDLEAELPGILNMCVDAYRSVVERGEFTKAQASEEMIKEYTDDNNVLKLWANEELFLVEDDEQFTTVGDLYAAFTLYADRNGFKFTNMTQPCFTKRLFKLKAELKHRYKQKRMDEGRSWVVLGLKCAPNRGQDLIN